MPVACEKEVVACGGRGLLCVSALSVLVEIEPWAIWPAGCKSAFVGRTVVCVVARERVWLPVNGLPTQQCVVCSLVSFAQLGD